MFVDTIAALRASAEAAAAEHAARPRDRGRQRAAQQRKVSRWRGHRDAMTEFSMAALCPNVRTFARWAADASACRLVAWQALAQGDAATAWRYRRQAIENMCGTPIQLEVMR